MLLAQTLALMHRELHTDAPGLPSRAETAAKAPSADADPGHTPGGNWVHRLFAEHHSGADCRLYEQAGHADTLPGLPLASLPLVLSSFALHSFSGLALARWAALFQARAPPFVR